MLSLEDLQLQCAACRSKRIKYACLVCCLNHAHHAPMISLWLCFYVKAAFFESLVGGVEEMG